MLPAYSACQLISRCCVMQHGQVTACFGDSGSIVLPRVRLTSEHTGEFSVVCRTYCSAGVGIVRTISGRACILTSTGSSTAFYASLRMCIACVDFASNSKTADVPVCLHTLPVLCYVARWHMAMMLVPGNCQHCCCVQNTVCAGWSSTRPQYPRRSRGSPGLQWNP